MMPKETFTTPKGDAPREAIQELLRKQKDARGKFLITLLGGFRNNAFDRLRLHDLEVIEIETDISIKSATGKTDNFRKKFEFGFLNANRGSPGFNPKKAQNPTCVSAECIFWFHQYIDLRIKAGENIVRKQGRFGYNYESVDDLDTPLIRNEINILKSNKVEATNSNAISNWIHAQWRRAGYIPIMEWKAATEEQRQKWITQGFKIRDWEQLRGFDKRFNQAFVGKGKMDWNVFQMGFHGHKVANWNYFDAVNHIKDDFAPLQHLLFIDEDFEKEFFRDYYEDQQRKQLGAEVDSRIANAETIAIQANARAVRAEEYVRRLLLQLEIPLFETEELGKDPELAPYPSDEDTAQVKAAFQMKKNPLTKERKLELQSMTPRQRVRAGFTDSRLTTKKMFQIHFKGEAPFLKKPVKKSKE